MLKISQLFICSLLLLTTLSSCNAFRRLTARDDSYARSNKKNSADNKEFLNIEVRPGAVVSSKHKTSGLKKSSNNLPSNNTNLPAGAIPTEKASLLQIKYAILLDAEIEMLNNYALLQKMEEWWGTAYCMGGSTKNCIDCSAFTGTFMKDVYNIALPRTAQEQYLMSEKISFTDLKEGDLVFFKTQGRAVSHVGVYLVNNKFIHASTSMGVTITDLNDKYWSARWVGAGRVTK
ncbi:MAG: C40 family peptidase [Chitinophagaceae bacterium]